MHVYMYVYMYKYMYIIVHLRSPYTRMSANLARTYIHVYCMCKQWLILRKYTLSSVPLFTYGSV